MAEKMNYRATLAYLNEKYPLLVNKKQVGEILGVSQPTLRKIEKKQRWTYQQGKMPIGTIASFICGQV